MRSTWLKKLCSKSFQFSLQFCGLSLVLAATGGLVRAGFGAVPEIDPGSLSSAGALLAGGILLIGDRFRRRSR